MERIVSKWKALFNTEEMSENERILFRDEYEWRIVECE